MSRDPRDLFRGSLIVAGRDLRSNAHGLKVWLMCGLALLLVLGAALGISTFVSQGPSVASEYVLWWSAIPGNNTTGGIRVWVSDYLGAPRAGQVVLLGQPFAQGLQNPPFVELARATTNATGWVTFMAVPVGPHPVRTTVGVGNITEGTTVAPPPAANLTVEYKQFDLLGDGARRDISFHATGADGQPIPGAAVAINGTIAGYTDTNGFFHVRVADGTWGMTVSARGAVFSQSYTIMTSPFALSPFFRGPDALLLFLGVSLMSILYPIIAIVMSYDAVAKERLQGSLELLLAKPATRSGLAIGKFLGSFLSVALPMIAVLVGSVVGIAAVQGRWPDGVFATAFVVGTLGLIAIYVLIMQIFSTLARSAGTTILAAITVWLIFSFLWSIVVTGVQAAFNIESATPAYFTLSTISGLFNPNQLYTLTVTTFMPASLVGLFGTTTGGSLPDWTGPLAMVIWILALLAVAIVVFRKRIT